MAGDLLTQQEAATMLRVSVASLEAWRAKGRGPAWTKPAGRVLYDRADLDAFVRSGRREPQPTEAR